MAFSEEAQAVLEKLCPPIAIPVEELRDALKIRGLKMLLLHNVHGRIMDLIKITQYSLNDSALIVSEESAHDSNQIVTENGNLMIRWVYSGKDYQVTARPMLAKGLSPEIERTIINLYVVQPKVVELPQRLVSIPIPSYVMSAPNGSLQMFESEAFDRAEGYLEELMNSGFIEPSDLEGLL